MRATVSADQAAVQETAARPTTTAKQGAWRRVESFERAMFDYSAQELGQSAERNICGAQGAFIAMPVSSIARSSRPSGLADLHRRIKRYPRRGIVSMKRGAAAVS